VLQGLWALLEQGWLALRAKLDLLGKPAQLALPEPPEPLELLARVALQALLVELEPQVLQAPPVPRVKLEPLDRLVQRVKLAPLDRLVQQVRLEPPDRLVPQVPLVQE
jgi:hypothetical protein